MTTKILVSVGSSIAAVVAAGTGAQVYQRTQAEREEARLATVSALQSFDSAIERVKSSIRQSTELRDDLLRKTDALFKDAGTTAQELVDHGEKARELQKRHALVAVEAGRLIADARESLGQATAAVGVCRQIVLRDALKAEQAAAVQDDIRAKTAIVKDVRARMDELARLGTRCEALEHSLAKFVVQNNHALARVREIKDEAEEKLAAQKSRQARVQEATEKLARLQAEMKQDLETIKVPKKDE
jgi:prefoldin subunit 5